MGEDKRFLANLEFGIAAFQDLTDKHVLSVSHNDGDGLTSSALVCKAMAFLKVPCVQRVFDRSEAWESYFAKQLASNNAINTVIITDLGSDEKQLCSFFEKHPDIDLFLLDHHKIPESERVDTYPGNFHSMNPTRFGLDGLREIAGSTLTYLFCERLTPRVRKLAWLPVIGMAGDILKTADKYTSYNKQVLDIAVEEGTAELHDGVALLGGMAEPTLQESVITSILPFVAVAAGDKKRASAAITRAGLDPSGNILSFGPHNAEKLSDVFNSHVSGKTVLLAGKNGLLRHSFEFNFLASIIGDENAAGALALLDKKGPSPAERRVYADYIAKLVSYMGQITTRDGFDREHFKFFEMGASDTRQVVSDVASFTSVNNLLGTEKMLVIAAKEKEERYKLSFRCSPEFVKARGIGMGTVIERLAKQFGGRGGGHDLAGGWNLPANDYKRFKDQIAVIDTVIR
nr:DHHA1 domain-containing protein [Candidatus Sigynarchaeum springense]MDO8118806.1 DHHA1 domain-containing protein [Candidatus Sigynarchaeota archaeon]